MKASGLNASHILILVGLLSYSTIAGMSLHPKAARVDSRPLLPPPPNIERFTLGYNEVFADSIWLRLIQNFDYCENPRSATSKDQETMDLNMVLEKPKGPSRCHLGWVYRMIDAVTILAPKFRMAQAAGATVLSVAVDDREGARRIFELAVKNFPDDWSIAYRAAYHYLYEIQDATRAAELLNQAAKNGGPTWLTSLAARLYSKSGQYEIAKNVLMDYLARDPEGPGAERARDRLAELEKQWAQNQSQSADPGRAPKSDDRTPAKSTK